MKGHALESPLIMTLARRPERTATHPGSGRTRSEICVAILNSGKNGLLTLEVRVAIRLVAGDCSWDLFSFTI